MEFWLHFPAGPLSEVVPEAQDIERDGWDGIAFEDTQNLSPDPFARMALGASATSRIGLSTNVSNPVTRHPAALSTAISTIHGISGGRAVLGIGRGDSALAHLGLSPMPVSDFERSLRVIRTYLRGDEVDYQDLEPWSHHAPTLRENRPGEDRESPRSSRIHWLQNSDLEPPKIDVSATGPRVIKIGAILADRVTFAVGASHVPLTWSIATARAARAAAGLDPQGLPLGAFMTIFPSEDLEAGRRFAAPFVAGMARFAAFNGKAVIPLAEPQKQVIESMASHYNMNRHGQSGAQTSQLTPEFIDDAAVLGPAEKCVQRLVELFDLGLDRVVLSVGTPFEGSGRELDDAYRRLVDEVIPQVRAVTSSPRTRTG